MRLRIYPPEGRVKISAPTRMSLGAIKQFITLKQEWIQASRQRVQQAMIKDKAGLESGERHWFMGEAYTLQVHFTNNSPGCALHHKTLNLLVKEGATIEEKEYLLNQWYRQQLDVLLKKIIPIWEKIIGVEAKQVRIRAMKTRWGSCNTRAQRIWINLWLIKKPQACVEYVIVHELIHLLEASHNQRFYQLMTQFLPDWKGRHAILHDRSEPVLSIE